MRVANTGRYISYNDIYVQTTDYPIPYSTSFDGEGAITSAIDYVVNERPLAYLVEGHGEGRLSTFTEQ